MGLAFQFFDHALSKGLGVAPVYYSNELMLPPPENDGTSNNSNESEKNASYQAKSVAKTILAPILAASLESVVANRAEVERYFGRSKFSAIETKLGWNPVGRLFAPAFGANAMRNVIKCNTSFILTPITYKLYYPQSKKSQGSLFWYGMGMNFAGNAGTISMYAEISLLFLVHLLYIKLHSSIPLQLQSLNKH